MGRIEFTAVIFNDMETWMWHPRVPVMKNKGRYARRTTVVLLRLAVMGLVGAPVAAGSFDGVFKPSPTADCTRIGEDGGALKIEKNVFHGVESQCRMTNPVNVRDMDAVLFDMKCTGEGTDWAQRALFMRAADDGLIMVWNGFAFKYARCGADPAAGTVITADEIGISD